MAVSVFDNKAKKPDDSSLEEVLGESCLFWEEIKRYLREEYGDILEEWKFYSQKSGWTLVLKRKKRTILYLQPHKDFFDAFFVFGEKAIAVTEKSALPESILNTIREARRYAEGRLFRVEVRMHDVIEIIKILIKIKIEN